MAKWYMVCEFPERAYDDEAIWTISTNPNEIGWINDSDQPGYGLTKARADYIVNVLNTFTTENERVPE